MAFRKYSSELRTQAMGLWATGKSMAEVAKELNLRSWRIPQRWKDDNYPESWESYKEELRKKTVAKMQESQLDSIKTVKVRHQGWLRALGSQTASMLIRKAQNDVLDSDVALDAFREALERESELYIPLKESISMRRSRGSSSISGAAMMKPTGEVGMLLQLNEMYDAGRRKIPGHKTDESEG